MGVVKEKEKEEWRGSLSSNLECMKMMHGFVCIVMIGSWQDCLRVLQRAVNIKEWKCVRAKAFWWFKEWKKVSSWRASEWRGTWRGWRIMHLGVTFDRKGKCKEEVENKSSLRGESCWFDENLNSNQKFKSRGWKRLNHAHAIVLKKVATNGTVWALWENGWNRVRSPVGYMGKLL